MYVCVCVCVYVHIFIRSPMLYYKTALNPKLRGYLGRTKMAFGEIDPRHHKF